MTLRTSFSKRLLYNAKERLWSFALTVLMLFFMFPVAATLLSTQENNYRYNMDLSEEMIEHMQNLRIASDYISLVGRLNMFYVSIFIAIAFILAMSGFAYLYSHKQVDFYHELPVTRKELFITNYIVGICYFAIPYAVLFAASFLIVQIKTGGMVSSIAVLQAYLYNCVMFVNVYSVIILAILLTGQLVVGFLGAIILGTAGTLVFAAIYLMADMFLITWIPNTTKLVAIMCRLSPFANYYHGATNVNWLVNLGIAIVEAAVFTAIGIVLYRKRPLEAAGRAMAFRVTEPFIKFVICYISAAFGGGLFYSIMGDSNAWGLFGIICALLISGCVVEIIYRGDFKKLFADFKVIVISGICVLTAIIFFKADLMGFDSYVPNDKDLDKVAVQFYEICPETRWSYYANPQIEEDGRGGLMVYFRNEDNLKMADKFTPANQEAAMALVNDGISNTQRIRDTKYATSNDVYKWSEKQAEKENETYTSATFAYKLKNGKVKYRKMMINTSSHLADVKKLYDDAEYKRALYPILNSDKTDIAAVNYKELEDYRHVEMPDDGMKDKLFDTYKLELLNLKAADMEKSEPVAAIQFKTNEVQALIDRVRETKSDYTIFNNYFYYPIYPQFKDTIALLRECGIEVGEKTSPDAIERIEIRYWPDNAGTNQMKYELSVEATAEIGLSIDAEDGVTNGYKELFVTDKDLIKEIMDAAYVGEIGIANPFAKHYVGLVIDVYPNKTIAFGEGTSSYAGVQSFTIALSADRVPQFIKDYFGLSDEEIKRTTEYMF